MTDLREGHGGDGSIDAGQDGVDDDQGRRRATAALDSVQHHLALQRRSRRKKTKHKNPRKNPLLYLSLQKIKSRVWEKGRRLFVALFPIIGRSEDDFRLMAFLSLSVSVSVWEEREGSAESADFVFGGFEGISVKLQNVVSFLEQSEGSQRSPFAAGKRTGSVGFSSLRNEICTCEITPWTFEWSSRTRGRTIARVRL